MGNTRVLRQLLEEELEALEPEDTLAEREARVLDSAIDKLYKGNYHFSKAEVNAIRSALDDVGEMYRFAGTLAGYSDTEVSEVQSARRFGGRAYAQAVALGIFGRQSGGSDIFEDSLNARVNKLTGDDEKSELFARHLNWRSTQLGEE